MCAHHGALKNEALKNGTPKDNQARKNVTKHGMPVYNGDSTVHRL